MSDIGVIAAVLVAYSLLSRRLERFLVSGPMFFVAAGILLGPDVADVIDFRLTSETGLLIAEIALVIVLFSDAGRIDLRALRENSSLPARLLGIGMPLTIALGLADRCAAADRNRVLGGRDHCGRARADRRRTRPGGGLRQEGA